MPLFRKKPVTIEAMQFETNNEPGCAHMCAIVAWVQGGGGAASHNDTDITIHTREGLMRAEVGDWIIREPFPTDDRRFYPCKSDIFEATYEAVE